ncbi:hypothetical protein HAPAU_30680 [Halalkalicoccus paucihalophilus]|uniref:Uncharacterized protein n=1 Tax=Halalkalicoccus paucihalophilus TaxID=1008153 RepID=A0A151AB15_9EURY|nr:hypothetical protein HAPAU_30680 [Halalkalicoccus paucihalophilus]
MMGVLLAGIVLVANGYASAVIVNEIVEIML